MMPVRTDFPLWRLARWLAPRLFQGLLSGLLLVSGLAQAELTIEITEGAEGAQPIAVVPFPGAKGMLDPARVVAADLGYTGRFAVSPMETLPERPGVDADIDFSRWRALGVENLVVGAVRPSGPGLYTVKFRLFDVFRAEQLAGYSLPTTGAEMRRTAHQVANVIYERLTGQPGAFTSHIAYVTEKRRNGKKRYALTVADADGFNPKDVVLDAPQPLMSPAWSPDGKRLAYVSFKGGRPAIYVQQLATGKRRRVAAYQGINGAPAFSPDSKQLAMTLSKGGNPDIYILDLESNRLRQLTRHWAIDTEATWAPDGQSLVFTSDRGGKPQLYRIPAGGGKARRVSFEGNYNAGAEFSPDGRRVAVVHQQGKLFYIAVQELESGRLTLLSPGGLEESPSFAPNGSMILYATTEGDRGVLAAVSVDGRVRQRLAAPGGKVRDPAWGP